MKNVITKGKNKEKNNIKSKATKERDNIKIYEVIGGTQTHVEERSLNHIKSTGRKDPTHEIRF